MSQLSATEQAKAYALQKTGLSWAKLDKWTDKNRTDYLAANAEFRNANPSLFTPAEMAAGANYKSTSEVRAPEFSYIAETWKQGSAQVGSVFESVASVGEGIKSTLRATKWLIPVAAIVAVAILLRAFAKRTAAA